MSDYFSKLGLNPALSQRKLQAALKEKRKSIWAQLEDSGEDARQEIVLRNHMEDIRKAEQSFPPRKEMWLVRFLSRFRFFENLFAREKNSLNTWPANLALFLALLPTALLFLPPSIVPDAYYDNRNFYDMLMSIIASLFSLGAIITGVFSLTITVGATKRKVFAIGLGFCLLLLCGVLLLSLIPNNGFLRS